MMHYQKPWKPRDMDEHRWIQLLDDVMAVHMHENNHRDRYHEKPSLRKLLGYSHRGLRPEDVEDFV